MLMVNTFLKALSQAKNQTFCRAWAERNTEHEQQRSASQKDATLHPYMQAYLSNEEEIKISIELTPY